jgi:hypothetical protein
MGKCESECVGHCDGTCFGENGAVTENDANCVGKCSSACNGTCRGRCKVAASQGIQCGAQVRCTGGCTGSFHEPVCTSTFKPPECEVNADCYAACETKVMAEAPCDPTQISIVADVASMPDLAPLVDTLEANLPALIDAAEKHGRLVMNAADRLGDAGDSLRGDVDDLTGKSLACIGEASSAVGDSVGQLDVSVEASLDVTVRTEERMQ